MGFLCRLELPTSVYLYFRYVCAKGAIYEVVFRKIYFRTLFCFLPCSGLYRSGAKRR